MKLKTSLRIVFFLLSFGKLSAQIENLNSGKYRFSKEVFEKKYTKQNFEKFNGKINILEDNSIQFDEKKLILENINDEYKTIFTNGILYPNIITENNESRIIYFNELKGLNPNPKIKRFVFWLHRIGIANPTECYFELENDQATDKTTLIDFIQNSKLTFYYRGTLII